VRRIPPYVFILGLLSLFTYVPLALGQTPGPVETTSSGRPSAQPDTSPPLPLLNAPARFGLGLGVGNLLTGVTAKLWAASSVAFQAAAGVGPEGNNLRAHLDLAFSLGNWTSSDGQYILPAYLGVGGVFAHDFAAGQRASDTEGGFRLPMGLSVLVRGNPVELFFEIAPEFTVRSSSTLRGKYGFYADGAIGARYYF